MLRGILNLEAQRQNTVTCSSTQDSALGRWWVTDTDFPTDAATVNVDLSGYVNGAKTMTYKLFWSTTAPAFGAAVTATLKTTFPAVVSSGAGVFTVSTTTPRPLPAGTFLVLTGRTNAGTIIVEKQGLTIR